MFHLSEISPGRGGAAGTESTLTCVNQWLELGEVP